MRRTNVRLRLGYEADIEHFRDVCDPNAISGLDSLFAQEGNQAIMWLVQAPKCREDGLMSQAGTEWISVTEASKVLGVARNTLKKLIREGTLPAYTVQGVRGFRLKRPDVEALLRPVVVASPRKQ